MALGLRQCEHSHGTGSRHWGSVPVLGLSKKPAYPERSMGCVGHPEAQQVLSMWKTPQAVLSGCLGSCLLL